MSYTPHNVLLHGKISVINQVFEDMNVWYMAKPCQMDDMGQSIIDRRVPWQMDTIRISVSLSHYSFLNGNWRKRKSYLSTLLHLTYRFSLHWFGVNKILEQIDTIAQMIQNSDVTTVHVCVDLSCIWHILSTGFRSKPAFGIQLLQGWGFTIVHVVHLTSIPLNVVFEPIKDLNGFYHYNNTTFWSWHLFLFFQLFVVGYSSP